MTFARFVDSIQHPCRDEEHVCLIFMCGFSCWIKIRRTKQRLIFKHSHVQASVDSASVVFFLVQTVKHIIDMLLDLCLTQNGYFFATDDKKRRSWHADGDI